MSRYLARVWKARYFWLALVQADLRNRYRGSALGVGWSLANPLAMTLLITVMFGAVFAVDPVPFAIHVLLGLAVWSYLTSCTLAGCQSFRFAEGYIRQASMPAAIYPLRTTLSAGFHLLVAGLVAVTLTGLLIGMDLPLVLVTLPSVLVILLVLGWSLGTLAAFGSLRFSDAPHLLEVVFQFVFYATPVIYPSSVARAGSWWYVLRGNPIHHLLELVRRPVIDQTVPSAESILIVALVTVGCALAAGYTLYRRERTLVFQL